MKTALFLVARAIVHPVAARTGDVLGWYPERGITVFRQVGAEWHVVHKLPHDAPEAVCTLHVTGALTLLRFCGSLPAPATPRQQLRLLS